MNPEPPAAENHTDPPPPTVPLRTRILTSLGILVLGMGISCPYPTAILMAPMYPYGFAKTLGLEESELGPLLGYLVLGVLTAGLWAASSRKAFRILCGALVVACAITTKGCHAILSDMSGLA